MASWLSERILREVLAQDFAVDHCQTSILSDQVRKFVIRGWNKEHLRPDHISFNMADFLFDALNATGEPLLNFRSCRRVSDKLTSACGGYVLG